MKKLVFIIAIVIAIIVGVVFINVNKNKKNVNNTDDEIKINEYKDIDFNSITIDEINELLDKDLYSKGYAQEEINDLYHVLDAKKAYKEYVRYSNHIKKDASIDEQKFLYDVFYGKNYASDVSFNETLFEMCKKNGDWSLYPLSNDVYKQYNEKDGLLGKDTFNTIELDLTGDMTNAIIKVKTTNSDGSFLYVINCDEIDTASEDEGKRLIDNITVTKTQTSNSEGNSIDIRQVFDNEHIESNFNELSRDGEKRLIEGYDWDGTYHGDNIAVSDNFRNKYPYFLDLFIHYSPLEYNEIALKDLDIEKQIATFEVNSLLECKKRIYEVKYKLTDDLYLNDAEVNKINEIDTEATNDNRTSKLLYQHSNWKELELTDNFLSNHKNDNGIVPLIDEINVDAVMEEMQLFTKDYYKYIYKFKLKNNNDLVYFVEIVCDDKGKIDQIMFNELPYTNISVDEAKTKFLADKELQKELGIDFE